MNMKTLFIVWICSAALAMTVLAQGSTATPQPAGAGAAAVAASPVSSATVSPSGSSESELEKTIKKKHKGRFNFTINDQDSDEPSSSSGDHHGEIPGEVIPIVAIVFLTIFATPVIVVGVIMYFGFSRNRMMHKTVRMMVEKGQPVPEALLAPPPPAQRQRSDMRRGVVLVMIGLGLMLFLGAVNDWESGAWSIGVIPFLIGAGYLLVWKLEGKRDNPPPVP
jgi:hypothetical protein